MGKAGNSQKAQRKPQILIEKINETRIDKAIVVRSCFHLVLGRLENPENWATCKTIFSEVRKDV